MIDCSAAIKNGMLDSWRGEKEFGDVLLPNQPCGEEIVWCRT